MNDSPAISGTFLRAAFYAYLYVFLEWLFLVTKPSFMGAWSWADRIAVLISSALPFVVVVLFLQGGGLALSLLIRRKRFRGSHLVQRVVPSLIATLIAFMLLDNFTYTVFGVGVSNSRMALIPLYWVFLLGFFLWHLHREPFLLPRRRVVVLGLLVLSCLSVVWPAWHTKPYQGQDGQLKISAERLPNIIFFAADGVDASHLSAYGYGRKTSPYLDAYLGQALVADNAFTNSAWTTGSLTSMMTGKYPSTTKVMYPPYVLDGPDAYQSLPAILNHLGYRSLQETVRYYADGPDLNWKYAFDMANGRQIVGETLNGLPMGLQHAVSMVQRLSVRLVERLGKVLFLAPMLDRYAAVAPGSYAHVYGVTDTTRMHKALRFMTAGSTPFFVHIHLMGTHCCNFRPAERHFPVPASASEKEKKQALYDGTILESDHWFGEIMSVLKERGLLRNTLIIYSSDHDTGWDFRAPVPLIFLFPGADHKGHLSGNVQLLDVAPTVLDYLGIAVPEWMEGRSLLSTRLDPYQPIFSVYRLKRSHFRGAHMDVLARVSRLGPPGYGLDRAGLVVCNRWYIFGMGKGVVKSGRNDEGKGRCVEQRLPTDAQAARMIRSHLAARGINTSDERDSTR